MSAIPGAFRRAVVERLDDVMLLGLVVIGLPLVIVLIGAPIAFVGWLATASSLKELAFSIWKVKWRFEERF